MGKDNDEPEVNPWPGGKTERQAYVNALEVERQGLKSKADRNPVDDAARDRRIIEIGEQLDRFEEKPQNRELETAGGGTRRGRSRQTS